MHGEPIRDIYRYTDEDTLKEALGALNASYALGIINDEKAFLSIVASYDVLLGQSCTSQCTNDIICDPLRSSYFEFTASLLRSTRLTIKELERILDTMVAAHKKKNRNDYHNMMNLRKAIWKWCLKPDFEPEWHMKRRGDNRPLPTMKGKNLWRYLVELYTDPEKSRMAMPSYVKKMAPAYPGYMECVKKAMVDGKAELKRIYGPDVDLTPLTEARKTSKDEYKEVSFMKLLNEKTKEKEKEKDG